MTNNMQCPLCASETFEQQPYPGSKGQSPQLHFDAIALCGGCGIGYAIPRVAQEKLDAFYAGGVYWHQTVGPSRQQLVHERNQCRQRVASVRDSLVIGEQMAVLDIGAGHGWTADALLEALPGIRLAFDFIEPDDAMSEVILARCTSFPVARRHDLRELDAAYDLIFLNHVLEHVADPVDFLQEVRCRLKPGAILYVETPHRDYRFKDDVFPHTLFFDPPSLYRSLRQARFTELRCETFGRWPLGRREMALLLSRVAYRAAVQTGPVMLQNFLDRRVWDYRPRKDGIWLRAVARNPDGVTGPSASPVE